MRYSFKNPMYFLAASILDIFGAIIFFPIRLLKKTPPLKPKNILVVRLDHIGDYVCTTPLFRNIKKAFPEAMITLLTNSLSKDMAYRDPNISKVITYSPFYLARGDKSSATRGLFRVIKDVRNIGFDLGIDPRGDLISILIMWLGKIKYRIGYGITGGGFLLNRKCKYDKVIHVIDRNLALLKESDIPSEDGLPSVYFNEKDAEAVEGLLHPFGIRNDNALVLHPFTGARSKEWPLEDFQKLINRLRDGGRDIILVGSKDDRRRLKNVIDLRGKISLPQLTYLIKRAGSFIGLDSGPANIAAALNVPSVIICSGTNIPQLWIPNNSNVRFVYRDVNCKPCGLKECNKKKHECMDSISVDDVIKVVNEL